MADITTHKGEPAVRLQDSKGETHLYLFTEEKDGDLRRYILQKVGGNEARHVVRHWPGHWCCSCPSYAFSPRPYKDCKHCRCAKAIAAFFESLTKGLVTV